MWLLLNETTGASDLPGGTGVDCAVDHEAKQKTWGGCSSAYAR
jgi:hypothetical protein